MSAIPASLTAPSPWRTALPAIVVVQLALVLAFLDTVTVMVGIWHRSETFAHAFLVLPISLWLVWRMRARLARLTPKPAPLFLVPMAAVAVVWLLSDVMVVNAASQFAFVALMGLAVPAVLGLEVALAVLFPLLFLFFMVPFGEFMLPPMMEWTADFVVYALQVTGIPVYREGLQFVIPTGNWSVVTECSGVRYLIASFMVGSLFAYLNYRSYTKRAVFMLVSLLVPILANWLRAYIIVMMGHLSGNKLAAGVDHILYGWVFFGIVIFIMFSIGMRWADPDEPDDAPAPGGPRATVSWSAQPLVVAALGTLLVAAAPQAVLWGLERSERAAAAPVLLLPERLGADWQAVPDPVAGWTPHFPGATVESRRFYRGPAGDVGVYLGYYRNQDVERKLVSSVNGVVAINDRTWNRVASGSRDTQLDGAPATVRTSLINGPARGAEGTRRPQLVTWQTYWIDGRLVAGDARAKIAGAWSRLSGRGDDGAVLILYADAEGADAAHRAIEAFAQAHAGTLGQLLQATRDTR
jgi:exosortase A